MKRRVKLAAILAAAIFACFTFVFSRGNARVASAQTRQVVTAGQRFKNLKVLNDIPADQLGKVMNIFSASLNVQCSFCHYTEDFSKDGKPEKDTARKMIAMTLGINKDNFGGETEVSCNTCHNGRTHPQSRPSLLPSPKLAEHGHAGHRPPLPFVAGDVIAKFAAAVGGKSAVPVNSAVITAVRVEPDKTTEPETILFKDGKYKLTTKYSDNTVTDLWDGTAASKFDPKEDLRLHSDEAIQIKREAQLLFPASLSDIYSAFKARSVDTIDDKKVFVITAESTDGVSERLSFDEQTGLLVRRVAITPTALGDFVYQVDYSDYKKFGDRMLPTVVTYAMPNMNWTRKILTVKLNAPVSEKDFVHTAVVKK